MLSAVKWCLPQAASCQEIFWWQNNPNLVSSVNRVISLPNIRFSSWQIWGPITLWSTKQEHKLFVTSMHLIIGKERWNFRKLLPEILVIAVLSFLVWLIMNGFNGITLSYLENCDKTLVFWHVITLACIHISIRFKITISLSHSSHKNCKLCRT